MTYVAYGRLGQCFFEYQAELSTDMNLFANNDAVFFPEPVNDPDGVSSDAILRRPMWDLGCIRGGEGEHLPVGMSDNRPDIWISYVPVSEEERYLSNLVHRTKHKLVAMSEFPYEEFKIGSSPPPDGCRKTAC